MAKRICPICDQVIKKRHYCSACKRIIMHPNIVNGGYYLNERHPLSEKNCEYHNQGVPQPGPRSGPVPTRPVNKRPSGSPGPVYTPAGGPRRERSSITPVILTIICIMFLISLLTLFLPLMMFII